MPSRIRLLRGGASSMPSLAIQILHEEPSDKNPSRNCRTSSTPASAACCLARTLPRSDTDLISQRSQRISGMHTADSPCSRTWASGRLKGETKQKIVGVASEGKAWSRLATQRVTLQYTQTYKKQKTPRTARKHTPQTD